MSQGVYRLSDGSGYAIRFGVLVFFLRRGADGRWRDHPDTKRSYVTAWGCAAGIAAHLAELCALVQNKERTG